ncbi:hypothetical protein J6590_008842 [Homalodisca vitripennis]|nr:hypothetical protein J6590_008842 [Homalodisca vitripennis]
MFYKPLRWLLRGIGIFPVCTPNDKYFAGLALLMIIPAGVHMCLMRNDNFDSTNHNLMYITAVVRVLTPVGIIIHSYLSRESYKSILADLVSVDNELKTDTTRMQKIMCSALGLFFVMKVIGFNVGYGIIFTSVSKMVVHFMFACPVLQHMVFVNLLASKFSALNIRLEKMGPDVATTPLQTTSARINSVFRLHTHLHVIVWDINSHFCFYNLLSVTTRLTLTVLRMYEYLRAISEGGSNNQVETSIVLLVEIGVFVAQCLLCHACAKEANRTVLLAHHLLQPDTPVQLWEEVGLFSRLALNNYVHFSVGGIFSLNRPLITKVAMTSLSYLIIAVQLKDIRLSGDVGPKHNISATDYGNSTINENFTTLFE